MATTGMPPLRAPLYGLRTWTVTIEDGVERLTGPHQGTLWPLGGEWLHAACFRDEGHAAPAEGCDCGIHAWHPTLATAHHVLAIRRQVPGIVECEGAVQLHADGFRAERARPHAFALTPGANASLVRRLAERHGAEVAPVDGEQELVEWCRERQLGLSEPVVAELLGPGPAAAARRSRKRRTRNTMLRLALAVAVAGGLVALGLGLQNDPPGERVLNGRTGEIHVGEDGTH
jgi:hypothetical protein